MPRLASPCREGICGLRTFKRHDWRIQRHHGGGGERLARLGLNGLNGPFGIAVSGGNLWVTSEGSGTIGQYNATTGAAVNAALVSGLNDPFGIAVSGGNLWVANQSGNGTIGEYNATTGAAINASLVSGLTSPLGIAVSGGNLWVANHSSGTIGEYNATTGAPASPMPRLPMAKAPPSVR